MKKHINKILTFVFVLSLMINTSCDNGLDGTGYQDDPNNTGTAPTANILGLSKLAAAGLVESDNARYAGINANYITGLSQQFLPLQTYQYAPADFNGLWTTIYQDGLKPAIIAENQGADENDLEMVGTAQMLQAIFLIESAANWGDVPNDFAIINGELEANYEGQVSVLQRALDALDNAITNAGSSTKYLNDGLGGTETTSTISRLANTLKARAYLIMKDYPNALTAAQNGIQNGNGDLIINHEDQIGKKNMFYQFLIDQRGGYMGPAGSFLENMLLNSTRSLATPGDVDRYNFYYSASDEYNTTLGGGIFAADASMPIISFYENKLIEAEAAYRTNQESVALAALNAVRDDLVVKYGGAFPHSTASGNALLMHILEEKYISIFPSPQTFHDLSRTNNLLGVSVNIGAELPKRYLYSQDEIDANGNVPNPIPDIFVQTPVNQ